jgi:uncharacterized membrane protein
MSQVQGKRPAQTSAWIWLISLAILLGVGFRLWHIDHKVYWFDEVYTTFRAAGHLGAEIDQAIFQNQPITPPELQQFQQLKPGSTALDTLRSLALEDPQHPPLYFLMARGWMQYFGSSILASRLLPVFISLLSLPLMYGLALELFDDRLTAGFSTALLALSPVDILFAQTARQYSLLTLMVIGSGWLLLRAWRLNRARDWLAYGLAVAMGWYTHVFFLLNWAGQASFALWQGWRRSQRSKLLAFAGGTGLALLLYSPWVWVLIANRNRGLTTTSWASQRAESLTYLKFWVLSFSALVVDSNGSAEAVSTYLPRLPVLVLLGFGLAVVAKTATPRQRAFILTSILGPFLLLVGADVGLEGQRSLVTRYLIGVFPGLQLATGYGLACLARQRRRLAPLVWAAVLVGSFTSGLLSARADTWWSKGISATNGLVADALNQTPGPLVVTDQGSNFINKGNLLSLSYRLQPQVILLPMSSPIQADRLTAGVQGYRGNLLVYAPSQALLTGLRAAQYRPRPTITPGLWQLYTAKD